MITSIITDYSLISTALAITQRIRIQRQGRVAVRILELHTSLAMVPLIKTLTVNGQYIHIARANQQGKLIDRHLKRAIIDTTAERLLHGYPDPPTQKSARRRSLLFNIMFH